MKDGKYVMEYRHEESSLQRAIVEGRHEVLVAAYQVALTVGPIQPSPRGCHVTIQ